MPQVLTTNAIILCPHLGPGTSIPTLPLWSVNGGAVLVDGDVGVLACPFIPMPCLGYRLRSMNLNASTKGRRPVMLVTDFNITFTGLPLTMAETHTTIDDSTPDPLPASRPAPALPPFLLDVVKPIVTAAPSNTGFVTSTSLPPTVVVVFTMTSAFPLKWILTRIKEPQPGAHEDLTNGSPIGAMVEPSGGKWSDVTETVTLTLNAAYMNAIGVGKHHFYMTGVSQRGLSGYTIFDLEVT